MTRAPRLALVGCGAIAELYHLPALARHPALLERLVLVDTSVARASELAARFGAGRVESDYRRVLEGVDGAIVTVPHHLHYRVATAFLERGVHVLCEKPLAASFGEAKGMVETARRTGAALGVNHTRRLFPSYRKLRELIRAGEFGELLLVRYTDGEPFTWPSASGFYFKPGSATGVLLDRGVHSLDTLCWWLGGKPTVRSSQNDAFGGVEGVAKLKLELGSCRIDLELSWLNKLDNTFRIVGERAVAEGGIEAWGQVNLSYPSGKRRVLKLSAREKTYADFGHKMVDNFIAVVRGEAAPLVPGGDVLAGLELLGAAYASATPFPMPWYDPWRGQDAKR